MQPFELLTSPDVPSHERAGGRGRALVISISNVGGRGGPTLNSVVFGYSMAAFTF